MKEKKITQTHMVEQNYTNVWKILREKIIILVISNGKFCWKLLKSIKYDLSYVIRSNY